MANKQKSTKEKSKKKTKEKKKSAKKTANQQTGTSKQKPRQPESPVSLHEQSLADAMLQQQIATLQALAEQNAQALSAQNSAAIQAVSRTLETLTRTLDSFYGRLATVEASLARIDARLDALDPFSPEETPDRRDIGEPFEITKESISATERKSEDEKNKPSIKPRVAIREPQEAKSIRQLMEIRAFPENRKYLDSINGNLGSALGFADANGSGDAGRKPAIIVFVPQKVHKSWIREDQMIKSELTIPATNDQPALRCPVTVVEGGKSSSPPTFQPINNDVVGKLRGSSPHLYVGSQLEALDHRGLGLLGSLGVFVRRKKDDKLGFITNNHVAFGDSYLWYPNRKIGKHVGFRPKTFLHEVDPADWYGPFAAEDGNSKVRVDCELVQLPATLDKNIIRQEVPTRGKLGDRYDINMAADMNSDDFALIGMDVMKIGRTTGLTHGKIWAFGYEWKDEEQTTRYTDLLIAPDRAKNEHFSQPGDSGSLVVTTEGLRPIALMWGGYLEKLRAGVAKENWTYATRLDQILDRLKVKLFTPSDSQTEPSS